MQLSEKANDSQSLLVASSPGRPRKASLESRHSVNIASSRDHKYGKTSQPSPKRSRSVSVASSPGQSRKKYHDSSWESSGSVASNTSRNRNVSHDSSRKRSRSRSISSSPGRSGKKSHRSSSKRSDPSLMDSAKGCHRETPRTSKRRSRSSSRDSHRVNSHQSSFMRRRSSSFSSSEESNRSHSKTSSRSSYRGSHSLSGKSSRQLLKASHHKAKTPSSTQCSLASLQKALSSLPVLTSTPHRSPTSSSHSHPPSTSSRKRPQIPSPPRGKSEEDRYPIAEASELKSSLDIRYMIHYVWLLLQLSNFSPMLSGIVLLLHRLLCF